MSSPFFQFLDTVGDGTGIKNAKGNYSGGIQRFIIKPAIETVYQVNRMIVWIEDGANLVDDKYGSDIVLNNGIEVKVLNDAGVKTDLTHGDPIKTNVEWARYCYDVWAVSVGFAARKMASVRWTFGQAGAPITLNGRDGDRLAIILHDNFSGLVKHKFQAQGTAYPSIDA
jgi:hypothetical protein